MSRGQAGRGAAGEGQGGEHVVHRPKQFNATQTASVGLRHPAPRGQRSVTQAGPAPPPNQALTMVISSGPVKLLVGLRGGGESHKHATGAVRQTAGNAGRVGGLLQAPQPCCRPAAAAAHQVPGMVTQFRNRVACCIACWVAVVL